MKGVARLLIVTAKVPRRKIAWGVTLAALVCCCALALNIGEGANRTTAAGAVPSHKGIRNNEDRVEYLHAYGWEVKEDPIATQEMLIPEEMDASYQDYLELQQSQGFDLTQYAGKRVKRYTYEITNYPTGETGVQANLLLYKNTVVGGEVLSAQMDGFLHGLTKP